MVRKPETTDSKTQKIEEITLKDLLAKEPEELQSLLESLNEDQLDQIVSELELKGDQLEAVEKKILSAVKELQKEIVELLPDYPVSKKIAVIINGDVNEDRHTGNVDRAIKALEKKGFEEIYVIGGIGKKTAKHHSYDVSLSGIDNLFTDLEKSLQPDSLVFFYGTGHGTEDSSMAIGKREKFTQEAILEKLKIIKEKKSRGIFVFDTCFSGILPDLIIQSGVEGVALSPAPEGETAMCQFFAPDFFKGLEEGIDLDDSGKTTLQEVFLSALTIYNKNLNIENTGEYRQTIPQLRLDDIDRLLKSDKPVLIEIDATWCAPCKVMARDISKVEGVLGSSIDIYKVTDDYGEENKNTSENAKALYSVLYEKIGEKDPGGFPRLLLIHNGKIEEVVKGTSSTDKILTMLKDKTGVEAQYDYYFKKAIKSKTYTEEQINKLIERFGEKDTFNLITKKIADYNNRKTPGVEINIPYKDIMKFDQRFTTQDIENFVVNFYSISRAKIYNVDKRRSIVELNKEAVKYSSKLNGEIILHAIKNKILITDEDLSKYDDRFDPNAKAALIIKKCPNSTAIKYKKEFDGFQIAFLHENNVKREAANQYDAKRFDATAIVGLYYSEIPGNVANAYASQFEAINIRFLQGKNPTKITPISSDIANSYDPRFTAREINKFVNLKPLLGSNAHLGPITNDQAIKYDARFTGKDIKYFILNKIKHNKKDLLKYNSRFTAKDIRHFYDNNIPYNKANSYHSIFSADNISTFHKAGINSEKTQDYIKLIKKNKYFSNNIDDIIKNNLDIKKLLNFIDSNFSKEKDDSYYFSYNSKKNKKTSFDITSSMIFYAFKYNIDLEKVHKYRVGGSKITEIKTIFNLIRARISYKKAEKTITEHNLDYKKMHDPFDSGIDGLTIHILAHDKRFRNLEVSNISQKNISYLEHNKLGKKILEHFNQISPINRAIIKKPDLSDERIITKASLFNKITESEKDWEIEQEQKDSSEFKLTVYQSTDKKNYHTFSVSYDNNYELNITFHTKCTDGICIPIDDIDTAPKFKTIKEFKKFVKDKSAI